MKKFVIRRVRLGLILLAVLAGVYLIQQVLPRQTAQVFVRMPEQVLIIDPGHGGEDGGAVSVSGQKESDINLPIALQLSDTLGVPLEVWTGDKVYTPQDITVEAREVARAYDRASFKDKNTARLALDLEPITEVKRE